MPLLSIVIPVYNVEKYLRTCLDSVICEGVEDYEIVCVNDGSTDSSAQILKEYEERFPELIRIVTTENGGLGAASNNGVKNARGTYVVFLDSDDYYRENAVQEILEQCRDAADICIFDFMSINDKGEELERMKGCHREEGVFTLEEYPQLLFEYPSRANKIFRRSLFSEYNNWYLSRVYYEDYRTNPKFYPFCKKIRYVSRAWYCYRQQPDSITHDKNLIRNLEIIDAAEDLLSWYQANGLYEKYRNELEYSVFYNALITSTDRVNLIDAKSDIQEQLLKYYTEKFPDYKNNPYVQKMSGKLKLLHFLIVHRQRDALHLVLCANERIRKKK